VGGKSTAHGRLETTERVCPASTPVIHAIAAKISCVVVDNDGPVSPCIESTLKYRRSATVHFIVLFEQDRPDQPDHRGRSRKDPDDVRAALDFFVQPFQRIGAVELPVIPATFGNRQAVGDPPELRPRRRVIGLREDRADDGCDGCPRPLRHGGQQIPAG
jgi:hypothetical protein